MDNCPKMSALNAAYARWTDAKDWDKVADFWDTLSTHQRAVVFASSLDDQVTNGGFVQWDENGYNKPITKNLLDDLCDRLDTTAAKAVKDMLRQFADARVDYDDYEMYVARVNAIDMLDYAVNDAFLADVEASL